MLLENLTQKKMIKDKNLRMMNFPYLLVCKEKGAPSGRRPRGYRTPHRLGNAVDPGEQTGLVRLGAEHVIGPFIHDGLGDG